jgi:segregation and condensation protein B
MTELSPRDPGAPVPPPAESSSADSDATSETDSSLSDEILVPVEDQIAAFKRAIEAIVLVAHDPVPPEMLAQLIEQPVTLVDQWCEELAATYRDAENGFELARVAGGFRYQTAADLTPYVERFLLHDQRARLSGAALETLAIVAYKQPISRAQVGAIRGVDPDGVIRTLAARGYIEEIGRDDGPGQAMLFGTTDVFLEKLGLDSLDNLPAIAEFIPGADVIELLEHGLRVTPQIEVAPTAVRHADEAQADDTGHDAQADDVEHDEELGDSNESLEDAHEGADAE